MAIHIVILLLLGVALALDPQLYQHFENRWTDSEHLPTFRYTPRDFFDNNNAHRQEEKGKTRDKYQYANSDDSPEPRETDSDVRGSPSLASSRITVHTGHEGNHYMTKHNQKSIEVLQDEISRSHRNLHNYPMKMSRFVADPALIHLIEEVNEADHQRLKETTTVLPEAGVRGTDASTVETVTVHYEATKVNVISYLWNEFINLGDLLGREVLDSVTARLSFFWRSFLKFFKSRRRRALPDTS